MSCVCTGRYIFFPRMAKAMPVQLCLWLASIDILPLTLTNRHSNVKHEPTQSTKVEHTSQSETEYSRPWLRHPWKRHCPRADICWSDRWRQLNAMRVRCFGFSLCFAYDGFNRRLWKCQFYLTVTVEEYGDRKKWLARPAATHCNQWQQTLLAINKMDWRVAMGQTRSLQTHCSKANVIGI